MIKTIGKCFSYFDVFLYVSEVLFIIFVFGETMPWVFEIASFIFADEPLIGTAEIVADPEYFLLMHFAFFNTFCPFE